MNRRIRLLVVVHAIAGIVLSGWAALEGAIPFVFDYILLVPPFALALCQSGLLAFWAAMSHGGIWKRATGWLAGVIALEILLNVPIEIDAYWFMPTMATGLVTAALAVVRIWRAELLSVSGQPIRSNRQGLQFSIRGLMLLTLLVAILITTGKQMRQAGWTGPNLLTTSALTLCFTVTNLAAVWAATGLGSPWFKCGAVSLLSLAIALTFCWCAGVSGDDWFYMTAIMVLEIVLLLASLLVVRSCGYRLVRYSTPPRTEPQQDDSDKGVT
jgi:hypothetical protein